MPAIKYKVTLSDDEIQNLERLIHKGKSASQQNCPPNCKRDWRYPPASMDIQNPFWNQPLLTCLPP